MCWQAHESHGRPALMASDHGVPNRDSFAKYTATFLAKACSAATRRVRAATADSPAPATPRTRPLLRHGPRDARVSTRALSPVAHPTPDRPTPASPPGPSLGYRSYRFGLELLAERASLTPHPFPIACATSAPSLGRVRRPRNRGKSRPRPNPALLDRCWRAPGPALLRPFAKLSVVRTHCWRISAWIR